MRSGVERQRRDAGADVTRGLQRQSHGDATDGQLIAGIVPPISFIKRRIAD